jgi:hypothetical protein
MFRFCLHYRRSHAAGPCDTDVCHYQRLVCLLLPQRRKYRCNKTRLPANCRTSHFDIRKTAHNPAFPMLKGATAPSIKRSVAFFLRPPHAHTQFSSSTETHVSLHSRSRQTIILCHLYFVLTSQAAWQEGFEHIQTRVNSSEHLTKFSWPGMV